MAAELTWPKDSRGSLVWLDRVGGEGPSHALELRVKRSEVIGGAWPGKVGVRRGEVDG